MNLCRAARVPTVLEFFIPKWFTLEKKARTFDLNVKIIGADNIFFVWTTGSATRKLKLKNKATLILPTKRVAYLEVSLSLNFVLQPRVIAWSLCTHCSLLVAYTKSQLSQTQIPHIQNLSTFELLWEKVQGISRRMLVSEYWCIGLKMRISSPKLTA